MIQHFLKKTGQNGTEAKKIELKALEVLQGYRWPGNVRELENAIERACALCDDNLIRVSDLPPHVVKQAGGPIEIAGGALPIGKKLDDFIHDTEKRFIDETIKHNGGNREKAARRPRRCSASAWRRSTASSK